MRLARASFQMAVAAAMLPTMVRMPLASWRPGAIGEGAGRQREIADEVKRVRECKEHPGVAEVIAALELQRAARLPRHARASKVATFDAIKCRAVGADEDDRDGREQTGHERSAEKHRHSHHRPPPLSRASAARAGTPCTSSRAAWPRAKASWYHDARILRSTSFSAAPLFVPRLSGALPSRLRKR